jgi:hypothetical protein
MMSFVEKGIGLVVAEILSLYRQIHNLERWPRTGSLALASGREGSLL